MRHRSVCIIMQNKQITIEDLEKDLRIDEHALEDALKVHAETFYKVSEQMTLLLSQRDEAKQSLEEIEAEVDIELRRAAAISDERVTDTAIANQRKSDRRVRTATSNHLKLKHEAARWAALKESFEQRSYALSKLVDLYIANYYGAVEHKAPRPQPSLRDIKANQIRNEMSTKRHRETVE